MVLKKYEIEQALHEEKRDIASGRLKEDTPLDLSEAFRQLCEACRRGDLKVCQEKIAEGVQLNARDAFDYTPLILVSCPSIIDIEILVQSADSRPLARTFIKLPTRFIIQFLRPYSAGQPLRAL